MYQRVNFDFATSSSQTGGPTSQSFEQTTANRWQFPLLVQYTRTLSRPKLRAFVKAGPSISHIGDSRSTFTSASTSPPSNSFSTSTVTGQSATWAGITAGGGIDVPVSRLHLRSEFRYSHWFAQNGTSVPVAAGVILSGSFTSVLTSAAPVTSSFRINQNEASFLLGLTF